MSTKYLLINPKTKKASRWLFIILSSFLYVTCINIFVSPLGLFPAGIGSLSSFATYAFSSLESYYSLIYLLLNIPLLIFSYFKNNRTFTIKTTVFIVCQAIFSIIYILTDIDETAINAIYSVKNQAEIIDKEYLILIFSGVVGAIFGAIIAISWKYGGSVGGTDIVSNFLAKKQKADLGKQLFISASIFTVLSFIVLVSIDKEYQQHWFIYLVGTIFFTLAYVFVLKLVFPKYAKVKLEIHSSKLNLIAKTLKKSGFPHSYLFVNVVSGYTNKERQYISTIVLLLEVKKIVKIVKIIDPHAWISIYNTRSIIGKFNTDFVDSGQEKWFN